MDKLLHALAGSTIAAAAYPFGVLPAALAVLAAAVAREVSGNRDWRDAAATIGAGGLMIPIWCLRTRTSIRRSRRKS